MIYLCIATLMWSVSFTLIGAFLKNLNSYLVGSIRAFVAFISILIFCYIRKEKIQIKIKDIWYYCPIGFLQIGMMYVFYLQSYIYLSVQDILLLTTTTPIYVALFSSLLLLKKVDYLSLLCASLAVLGAILIRYKPIDNMYIQGLILVQLANLCFALGQVLYKKAMQVNPIKHTWASCILQFSACLLLLLMFLISNMDIFVISYISNFQWLVLIFLGVCPSALGYIFWNKGATYVKAGTLATMNNLVVPIGVIIDLIVYDKPVNWMQYFIGGSLILLSLILPSQAKTKVQKTHETQ